MTAKETRRKAAHNVNVRANREKNLILYNDDVHTFDYVIQALMEVCDHDYIQASQCTIITHYKGKCDIKHGVLANLKAMKDALSEKELTTTID
jgi:ATP-dependent Clp protease adaptor protein ClpS